MITPVRLWLAGFSSVFAWSAWQPRDAFVWALEVAPALIALAVLAATRRRFPLTPLSYLLILAHSVILMVGGHYTYAEVPLFGWLDRAFDLGRNHYDKVGHFAQGFVPAIVTREVLARLRVVNGAGWLAFVTVCICLAVSALYELFEWAVAGLTGEAADAFLGTQGYVWDTQSDMGMALIGAILALVALGRLHDRQLAALQAEGNRG